MSDPLEGARVRGANAVAKVAREVDANESQTATMLAIEKQVRHGYAFIDIIVRSDGVEKRYQGDWIAQLFRQPT